MIKPLAKSILIPLGLTAAASAADAGIHKKILGYGHRHSSCSASCNTKILIISKDEMNDTIKIVKSLEDSDLLLKGVTETVQNEVTEQKQGFLTMLLGTLGATLLGNILTSQGVQTTSQGWGINRSGKSRGVSRAGEGVLRAGYGSHSSKMEIFNAASSFN